MPYTSRPKRFAPEGKFRVIEFNQKVLDRHLIEDFNTLEKAQIFAVRLVAGKENGRASIYDDKGIEVSNCAGKEIKEIHAKLHNLLKTFLKNNPDGVREIAHEFGVSLLTVKRWEEGINFPHTAMCPAVITYLKKE